MIDADGREIPWNMAQRIDQNEMEMLVTEVVKRIHIFLATRVFTPARDQDFELALDRAAHLGRRPGMSQNSCVTS